MVQILQPRFASAFRWVQEHLPASTENFITVHSSLYFRTIGAPDPHWAEGFFIQASEPERARWLRELGTHVLRYPDSNPPDVLLDYWRYRLTTGLPSQITEREQAALLAWLRIPGIDFPAAVDLFLQGPLISGLGPERF